MKTRYDLACAMEDGLDSVRQKLARALMMMAENLGEHAGPIIEVGRHIRDHAGVTTPVTNVYIQENSTTFMMSFTITRPQTFRPKIPS
jgi:hypothetical protein